MLPTFDNVLQLQEVGDFEAQNFLPPLNLIRSTKLHLTTEPPISCRCCYSQCLCFGRRSDVSSLLCPCALACKLCFFLRWLVHRKKSKCACKCGGNMFSLLSNCYLFSIGFITVKSCSVFGMSKYFSLTSFT